MVLERSPNDRLSGCSPAIVTPVGRRLIDSGGGAGHPSFGILLHLLWDFEWFPWLEIRLSHPSWSFSPCASLPSPLRIGQTECQEAMKKYLPFRANLCNCCKKPAALLHKASIEAHRQCHSVTLAHRAGFSARSHPLLPMVSWPHVCGI